MNVNAIEATGNVSLIWLAVAIPLVSAGILLVLGRTYAAKRFTHQQATSAIVVSYYWHFVDVVWIGLFTMIYLVK